MNIYNLSGGITLIDIALPIPGHEGTLCAYIIKAEKIALIDLGPASTLPGILQALSDQKIDPEDVDYILSTHIHLDHMGGVDLALDLMPRAQTIVHPNGVRHLLDPSRLWEGSCEVLGDIAFEYGKPEPVAEDRILPASDGMMVDLGNMQLEVFLTPGHANHHLSFLDRQRSILFPGEAAGIYFPDTGISRPASPPPFDLRQAITSVDRLIALDPRELYYSHFGHSPDAGARLHFYREQLISWGRTIADHLDEDPELIADRIITLDKTKEQVYRSSGKRFITETYFINNSVRGYLDYFSRKGTGVLLEVDNLPGS